MKNITQLQRLTYSLHEFKSNTAYKLEEVEKTFVYVEFLIASNPLEKDYIQLIVSNWIEVKIPPIPVIVIFSGHTHFLLFEDLTVHTMYIPALLLAKVSDFNTHLKQ